MNKYCKSLNVLNRLLSIPKPVAILSVLFCGITSGQVIADENYAFNSEEIIINGHEFNGVVVPSVSADSLPYKGVDTQLAPSVIVMGQIGNVFIEGNRFGYLLNRSSYGGFSAVAQIRSHQYLPEDNTLNLESRDKAFEIGAQFARPLGNDWFGQITAFTDISGVHKGQELELSVYRRDFFGDFRLLTLFAAQQQTKSLTGYYADVSGQSADVSGLAEYQASADLNFEFELIGIYELTSQLNALFVYRHYIHGDGFSSSPLADGDQTQRFVVGLGWSF